MDQHGFKPCPFLIVAGVAQVTLKQLYMDNPRTTGADSSSVIPTLSFLPDDQVCKLSADATQWTNSLLQDVYDFISKYQKHANTACPTKIPQFCFVTVGLAMTTFLSDKKEVFLIEELIWHEEEGSWRKYINNNSYHACYFPDNKNQQHAEFLAFCQHVQYWRTGGLMFTSDYQGMWFSLPSSSMTNVELCRRKHCSQWPTNYSSSVSIPCEKMTQSFTVSSSDLGGKLFSQGNIQQTHSNFKNEHIYNTFCKSFKVPTIYSPIQSEASPTTDPDPVWLILICIGNSLTIL